MSHPASGVVWRGSQISRAATEHLTHCSTPLSWKRFKGLPFLIMAQTLRKTPVRLSSSLAPIAMRNLHP